MIKKLIRDYFQDWKLSRLVELYKKNYQVSFLFTYVAVSGCVGIMFGEKNLNLRDSVMALSIFLPSLFVFFSVMLHPVRLHKMNYLCPMSAQERTRYVRNSYYFRIVMHMVILGIGVFCLLPVSYFHPMAFIFILLNDLIISSLIPVENDIDKGCLYPIFLIPFTLYTNLAELVILSDEKQHLVLQIALFCVMGLIELPLMLGFRKHIKRELDAAICYEKREA